MHATQEDGVGWMGLSLDEGKQRRKKEKKKEKEKKKI